MAERVWDPISRTWKIIGSLGADPGIGVRRTRDIMSRLPQAELAGAVGPGVVPRGSVVNDHPVAHDETIRPMSGLDEMSRGNQIVISPPSEDIGETPPRPVVQMRSRGADAELLNICLGIELADYDNEDDSHFGPILPYIRCALNWGIGGASFNAYCDWMQGTQLSIPANFVSVSAVYVKIQDEFNQQSFTPPNFRVAAGLSYGNTGRISSPARYTQVVQLGTGANGTSRDVTVQIPPFATSVTMLPTQQAATQIRVRGATASTQFFDTTHTLQTPLSNQQYNVENAIPLFGGARYIEVTNLNVDGEACVLLVYSLAL